MAMLMLEVVVLKVGVRMMLGVFVVTADEGECAGGRCELCCGEGDEDDDGGDGG